MNKKLRKNSMKSGKDKLFGIITTLLVIVLIAMICIFAFSLRNNHTAYVWDADTILRQIDNGNYEYAIQGVSENRILGVDETTDSAYEEAYAVVDYFQAEMDYKVYSEMGDNAKASAARKAMKKAYKKMGDMKYKSSEIDEIIMLQ